MTKVTKKGRDVPSALNFDKLHMNYDKSKTKAK